jgi:sulfur carrier protein
MCAVKSERKITVSVNGEERRVVSDLSVEELLNLLGVKGPSVAVARNQAIIPRSDYFSTTLEKGDQIEIIHAVGGGAS